MFTPSIILLLLFLTLLPTLPRAELSRIVTSPSDTSISNIRTAPFKFYGNKFISDSFSVNASAVVLTAREVCSPSEAVVRSKIVVTQRSNDYCDLEEAFQALDDSGAVAFVSIVGNMARPGLHCYRVLSWNPSTLADRALVLLEATALDFDRRGLLRELEEWRSAAAEERLELRLSPPWETELQDFFESWTWTVFVRIIIPCFAFYTAATAIVASKQYYDQNKDEWGPGRIICLAEIPILALLGIVYACGLYVRRITSAFLLLPVVLAANLINREIVLLLYYRQGPIAVPFYFTIACYCSFSGFSHATSILMAVSAAVPSFVLSSLLAFSFFVLLPTDKLHTSFRPLINCLLPLRLLPSCL